MPFDCLDPGQEPPDQMAPFRARREAAAEAWARMPPRDLNFNSWQTCALGWLAQQQHDGWAFDGDQVIWRSGHSGVTAAAFAFHLDLLDSARCFGVLKTSFRRFHGRWLRQPTPTDIGRTLLRLPYRAPLRNVQYLAEFNAV